MNRSSSATAARPAGSRRQSGREQRGDGRLADAINQPFARRAQAARRRLRELFRRGRISLLIGLAFLTASSLLANALAGPFSADGMGGILRDSIVIGGWVAMWRPLEVFLYDWWPIRAEARRYDRLAAMPVRVEFDG